ncbi:hypothetical protein [Carnobacterium maltaromaticum]|uniref:hypothetical protein n=1 Tax=Carnobacterium maltaromaticum TaxID=2751 RepID=UPI0011425507|nr:hypothetical protein [Carnobacterium maltaromaticum]GED48933.1 hypothetical protein CMA01_13430 [Carnobacterium maltaromaticum]
MAKIELYTNALSSEDKNQIASALKLLNKYGKVTQESLSKEGQEFASKLSNAIKADIDIEIR